MSQSLDQPVPIGPENIEAQNSSSQRLANLGGDILTNPLSNRIFSQSYDNELSFPSPGEMTFSNDIYGGREDYGRDNIVQGENGRRWWDDAGNAGGQISGRDAVTTNDQAATSDASAATVQDSTGNLEQQILTDLTQISQELQKLIPELTQLLEGGGSGGTGSGKAASDGTNVAGSGADGNATGTGGGTDSPNPTSPATPSSDSAGGSATSTDGSTPPSATTPTDGSTSPSATTPTDGSPAPASGDSTGSSSTSSDGSTAPTSSTSTDGQAQATISTPNGIANVGSTATVFGPDAMPTVAPVAGAFYVSADATGHGTGPLGSETDPFSTLQQAQQAMESSNVKTTYVEGGTYDLSSTLNLTGADSGESFVGLPGSGQPAVIDGGGSVSNLVSINGANDVTLSGLDLQDTQSGSIFSTGDWNQNATAGDAIVAQNSTGDNFSYDAISNVGMALDMRGVSNSQMVGNDITNVQEAINLSSASTNSDNDNIASNSISNVSDVASSPYGAISLMQASNDTIANNVINNITGAGIRVGGNIGQDSNGDVVTQNTVTNTNTAAYATTSYSGQGDNGAIYAWQGPGNTNNMDLTISNNYVANAGQGFEDEGIYLDDGVDGATVTGNVVKPNGMGWAMNVHGGSDNTIQNNVLDLSSATGQEKGILYQNDGPQMTNNNISDNIIYSSTANGGAYTFYDNANDTPTVGNNEYQGVATPSQDTNPISADPQFVDPADGNYTVQAGSPATAIQF